MSTDRTAELIDVACSFCRSSGGSEDACGKIKRDWMLKPVRATGPFLTAAVDVGKNIETLQEFIVSTRKDYVSNGRYSRTDKDTIEQEVGQTVRACGRQIEQLKDSVLAAQQAAMKGAAREGAINEQTASHMQGIVLILVERLTRVSASFDKCRAVRYQQAVIHAPKVAYTTEAAAAGPARHPANGTRTSVNGAVAGSSHQAHLEDGSAGSAEPRPPGGAPSLSVAQQAPLAAETQALLEELTSTSQGVHQAERAVREVAALNDMLSTAVMHQAEQIEQLYNDSLYATFNVQRGNRSLRKAIDVNRASRKWMVVLLLVATFSLLFYDWFNS